MQAGFKEEHTVISRTFTLVGTLTILAVGLGGCQKPNFEEMMKAPPRPAELDQLNAFIGTWEGNWEMTMAGSDKPKTFKGIDQFAWDADKWVLTEHMQGTMDNNKMLGTGLWTWNPQRKLFQMYSVDNYGMIMTGTGRYDAATATWHMKGQTQDTRHGQRSVGAGTIKLVDPTTMEWHWTEWDGLHLTKFMEMRGTSHKK